MESDKSLMRLLEITFYTPSQCTFNLCNIICGTNIIPPRHCSRFYTPLLEVHSLTSVLSARNKAAFGISQKPQGQIDEIDLPDAHNQFALVEYTEDLYKFYKEQEPQQEVTFQTQYISHLLIFCNLSIN